MAGNSFSHIPIEVEKINTKYRRIKTKLPVPKSLPLFEKIYKLETRAMHGQIPLIWDRAKDFQILSTTPSEKLLLNS